MLHKELAESFIRRKKYVECEDIATFDPKDRDPSYSDVYRQHEKKRLFGQYELIYTPYDGLKDSGMITSGKYPNLMEIIRRGGVIAGSFPLYLLIGSEFDDIDIFVTSKEDFNSIKEYIMSFKCLTTMYEHSMKFKVRNLKFNLIARIYRCKEEIVYGFDLPASQIMFTGKSLAYTPLLDHVINTGYMEVDGNRLSPTYFQRLNKYWKRGVIKTIYFPAYKLIRERLIEFPIFHQAWYLKDIPSRSEGFASPMFGSEYQGTIKCQNSYGFMQVRRNGDRRVYQHKGMYFVLYEGRKSITSIDPFDITFIVSNPGDQVNSTIFPTPIVGLLGWKAWIEREIGIVFTEKYDDEFEIYDDMTNDAHDAYLTAKYHGSSPDLETIIMTDANASYRYARDVIKGRWVRGEGAIYSDESVANLYDSRIRYKHDIYASLVDEIKMLIKEEMLPKHPSDLKEKYWSLIKTRPDLAVRYATYACIRSSELEYLALTSSQRAYRYAKNVIKGRWEAAEKIILTDVLYAHLYARDIIKGRWHEAERILISDPKDVFLYARDVIKGRWIEGEHIILTDSYYTSNYALNVIKGRWEEAEKIISFDPFWSNYYSKYARTVDPELAYLHARDVIKGRWKKGETIIKTCPQYAFLYARDVIKSEWEEAEDIISSDPVWSAKYDETFTTCLICCEKKPNMAQTPCNHEFCMSCYSAWIQRNDTCPYCRQTI